MEELIEHTLRKCHPPSGRKKGNHRYWLRALVLHYKCWLLIKAAKRQVPDTEKDKLQESCALQMDGHQLKITGVMI